MAGIRSGNFNESGSSNASKTTSGSTSSQAGSSSSESSWSLSNFDHVKDEFKEIRQIFQTLSQQNIPGPRLVRMNTEFNLQVKRGGQARVSRASIKMQSLLSSLERSGPLPNVPIIDPAGEPEGVVLHRSGQFWRNVVIKQLRTDDGRADLTFQVGSALSEIKRLCHPLFRRHRNVVSLLGWGLCLDLLESASFTGMPLLILERASFDLHDFIKESPHYKSLPIEDLYSIGLDIGRGLEAVHAARISHGDLKLENILIFEQTEQATTGGLKKWMAKLCDFGSANEIVHERNLTKYLGTPTWRPPECLESSPPVSLQLCDIFAYGLVIWSLFMGHSSSPIREFEEQETADDIRRLLGQQRYFEKALKDCERKYSSMASHLVVEDRELERIAPPRSIFIGSSKIQSILRIIRATIGQLSAYILERSSLRSTFLVSTRKTYNLGPKANRVLKVLQASLNDKPQDRELRPWIYFDLQYYTRIPQVDAPTKFSSDSLYGPGHIEQPFSENSSVLFRQLEHSLQSIRLCLNSLSAWLNSIGTVTKITFQYYIKRYLPSLLPRNSKQRVYDSLHYEMADFLGLDPDETRMIEHGHDSCPQLSTQLFRYFNEQWQTYKGWKQEDLWAHHAPSPELLYSICRIRSRLKQCCWNNATSRNIDLRFVLFNQHDRKIPLETLAWLLRGDCGLADLKTATEAPDINLQIGPWSFLTNHTLEDEDRTLRILLYLERERNIGQLIPTTKGSKERKSIFRHYLEHLRDGRAAITLCQHFRRISQRENITPGARFFFTGSIDGYQQDITAGTQETETERPTTALHDAVVVSNYPVVEYLVDTGFVIRAKDDRGHTALEVAEQLPSSRRDIVALLRSRLPPRETDRSSLPLGWEESCTQEGRMVYHETSIESNVEAVTFELPKAGLLQDNRLRLAGRTKEGRPQTYILNPLRFLRKVSGKDPSLKPATNDFFNKEWYQNEIKATRAPFFDVSMDDRWWYRNLAGAIVFLWPVISQLMPVLILTAFCIAGRSLLWSSQIQLILNTLAMSLVSAVLNPAVQELLIFSNNPGFDLSSPVIEFLRTLASCIPEAMLGTFAVIRANVAFAQSIMAGAVLCNNLLVLGLSMLIGGIRQSERSFNQTTYGQVAPALNLLGPFISLLLHLYYAFLQQTHPTEALDGVLLISHTAAIVFICIWFSYVHFRLISHHDLFDLDFEQREEDRLPSNSTRNNHVVGHEAEGFKTVLLVWTSILLMLFFCDNLNLNLHSKDPHSTKLFALYIVPLVIKAGIHIRPLKQALDGYTDQSLDWTLIPSVHMVLFVGPIFVIVGWIVKVPMTLHLEPIISIFYALNGWLMSLFLFDGKTNYLKGFMLFILYVIMALAYGLYT
ncbi:hypothetical protein AOQ84DRAFT_390893 [Glonium stellatum]|uniref:Protein kinase domain-containing protein n=1 Tax=Glonium stellatum TaxID=574774 RepID=A0A8E2EV13_9PEZI|nr:hypothetical protein AOQ84DRAFT_390893 [Glonium stellatum]